MKLSFTLFALILFTSLTQFSTETMINGFSIEDLRDQSDDVSFENEAMQWSWSQYDPSNGYYFRTELDGCYSSQDLILGGPNGYDPDYDFPISWKKEYKNLSPHDFAAFSIAFYYFGDPGRLIEGDPVVSIHVDNVLIGAPKVSILDVCVISGGLSPTFVHRATFQGTFSHANTDLILEIKTLYEFKKIQVGFRDVIFLLSTYPSSSSTPNICQAPTPTQNFVNDECQCEQGEAWSGSNGPCQSCDPNCQLCFETSPSGCNKCQPGLFWHGENCNACPAYCQECDPVNGLCISCALGSSMHADGKCSPTCDGLERTLYGQTYCIEACSDTSQYRFVNGQCSASCPLKIETAGTINFCYSPCPNIDDYLYPDGSCLIAISCESGFSASPVQVHNLCEGKCGSTEYYYVESDFCSDECRASSASSTNKGIQICKNHCYLGPQPFFFQNATCLASCPFPLVSEEDPSGKYCSNPCPSPSTQYLYTNSSCLSTCPSPLLSRSESGVQYCWNPCSSSTQFLFSNSSCLSTCPSPLLSRSEPGVQYCWNPCSSSTQFLFSNGSCLNTCPPPLSFRTEPGVKYCWNPCPNPSTHFLYTNGSCLSTCPSPLFQRSEPGVQYCWNPCSSSTPFLFSNGSCLSSCPYPLQYRTEAGNRFCWNPCPNPSSDYLYPNQTCSSTCESPLFSRTEPGVKYCWNPCSYSQFLFSNQSCLSSCPYPLVSRAEPIGKYCWNPCPSPSTDFLYTNSSCLSACPLPLFQRSEPGVKYCWNPCSPSTQYLFSNGSCINSCPPPLVSRTESGARYCWNPCPDPISQFLYTNDTCSSTCLLASRLEPGVKYCYNPCPNPASQYLYPNQSCSDTCSSPLIHRSESGVMFCFTPCPSSEDFIYLNGSCLQTCQIPFAIRTESAGKICYNPCETSQYLHWDGSCISTCSPPFVSRFEADTHFCAQPCDLTQFYRFDGSCSDSCELPLIGVIPASQIPSCTTSCSSSQYVFPHNGSCIDSCPSPLKVDTNSEATYCKNPCDPSSEYLHEDGSCKTTCTSPYALRSEPGVTYCSLLCTRYLTAEGVCLPKCDPPFKQKQQGNTVYCNPPCDTAKDFYYPDDSSCQKSCEYPYEPHLDNPSFKTCTLKLSEAQAEQAQKIAETTDVTNSLSNGGVIVGSLLASSDSTSATMGPLAKMLSYIKFMDIKFPPKVQLMFYAQSTNSSTFSFLNSIPNKLQSQTSNRQPPGNFKKYHVSSNFLVNFWQNLFILGVILFIILISTIIPIMMKGPSKVTDISRRILATLKWNMFLTLFCGTCGDIVLFTALEFQTMEFNSFLSAVSFITCLAMNVLMFFTLYKILTVNSSVRTSKKSKTSSETKEFEEYKTLYECYKEDSYYQQIFLFIFIIRVSVFNGVIAYLHPHPLAQAVIIVLLNGGILAYLIIKRPMRKIINFIQQVAIEGSLFVFNICVFILAVLDSQKSEDWSARENLGNVLIALNVATPMVSSVIIVIKILLIVKDLYMEHKRAKSKAVQKLDQISIHQSRAPAVKIEAKDSIFSSTSAPEIYQNNSTMTISQTVSGLDVTDQQLLQTNHPSSLLDSNFGYSPQLHQMISPQRSPDLFYQNQPLSHMEFSTLNVSQVEQVNSGTLFEGIKSNPAQKKKIKRTRPARTLQRNISYDPSADEFQLN